MDWQQVEEAASMVLRDGKLPTRSKEAIKRALASRNDPQSVLEALCVLDSLALNCGRTFRSALAAPKWMKRLTQCHTAAYKSAPAVAQLLANWELTFRGEELGASAHAARKQLQASTDIVPQPNHFAHEMREYFQQHIPFIGFQHGFDFLSAFSETSPSPTGGQDRPYSLDPAQVHPITEFRVEYLQDMSADACELSLCTAALQHVRHGQRLGQHESTVRKGNALSSKCCNWRACIQEWAADELLSYSLADMLVMNDRLHAELERWEQATQSLILTQSMPMAASMETLSDGGLQDHSQWFSPLGSSASRFTQDQPTPVASTLPAVLSGVPLVDSNALGRNMSIGEEAQTLSGSAQQGTRHFISTSAPPGAVCQPCHSSRRQASAEADSATTSALTSPTRTGGAPPGNWVAFDDSAQWAMPPVPSHSQTAWNMPLELLPPSAQSAHRAAPAQPVAAAAGTRAAPTGNTSDQSTTFIPGFPTASAGSSSAQAVACSASDQLQDSPSARSLLQTQGMDGAPLSSIRCVQDTGFDLQHWGGAHALGQSPSTALAGGASGRGSPGSMPSTAGRAATVASMQPPVSASCRPMPTRVAATSCSNSVSATAGPSLAQPSAEPILDASGNFHELYKLKQELAAERAARSEAEQQLESSRARESGLQRQLTEMQEKLRDREFQLWNARLAAQQSSTDDKGAAKQGTTHAIMAWCHQPALRVRFSAGQLEALAGCRELR